MLSWDYSEGILTHVVNYVSAWNFDQDAHYMYTTSNVN